MNKLTLSIFITVGFLQILAVSSAQAQQIYTWTDVNGVVHYVDTPDGNPDAVSIEAPEAYKPGSANAYPPTADANADAAETADSDEAHLSFADERRKEITEKKQEHRKLQAENEQKCELARNRVENLEPSQRVYFTNAEGETERMDDEERVRLVAEAEAMVAKYCK